MNLFVQRRLQILKYGWRDAGRVANGEAGISRLIRRLRVFVDILRCFGKYYLFSNQYFDNQLWRLPAEKKVEISARLGAENLARDKRIMQWRKSYYSNWKFLSEYTQIKYETSSRLQQKRNDAYRKRFNMGKNCWIESDVTLNLQHFSDETISIGDNVLLSRGADIDFTGGVVIGDDSGMAEGAKILTHVHDHLHLRKDQMVIVEGKRAVKIPLKIGRGVRIGARAIVMPGVREIGDGAWIGAGEVVRRPVPPHCMVRDGRCVKMS